MLKRFISILQDFSRLIWRSSLYQRILFFAVTLITVFIMGYYFGTFDQAIHIPFLKKFADPTLFPNDPFFDLRFHHYSYFWFLFVPFQKLGILEITMFLVYLAVVYLTFWALWKLSKTLFNDPLTSVITIITSIFPHLAFAGFTVFQFSLLNRSFVLPFLLLAIDFYLNRKYVVAFLLLGLMYNIHVISVNFVIFMFLFDSLLQIKRIGWKKVIVHMSLFVLAAFPVLIWKMGGSPVQFSANKEWFDVINKSMMHFIFNLVSSDPMTLLLTLGGIASVVIFFFAESRLSEVRFNITVKNFVYSLLLVLLVSIFTTYFYPSVIIIQSQIIRAGLFILIFSYLYITRYFVKIYQSKSINESGFFVFLTALTFSLTPLILLTTLLIYKYFKSKYWTYLNLALTVLSFSLLMLLSLKLQIWRPGIYISPEPTPEYDVEIWAKNNTPKNALFITPPYKWWFFTPEWRAISERSTVITLYDQLEFAFAPQYLGRWKNRFKDIAPGALEQFDGNVFKSITITKEAFYSRTEEHFKQIAQKYGASYLLVEKPFRYDFPIVYENGEFTLYDLRSL
ncbi:hypothetical protein HYW87_01270 [Candidatus Roizmanbacteria bacterium]|nr:hypothetical protein [Candidatus Roizmanbacteria bacterium]